MKKSLSTGFIDPVSLITLGFLIVGLVVTTAIVKNPDISLDIRQWAYELEPEEAAFLKKHTKNNPKTSNVVNPPANNLNSQPRERIQRDDEVKDDPSTSTVVAPPVVAPPPATIKTDDEIEQEFMDNKTPTPKPAVTTPKPSTNPFANITGSAGGGTIPKETESKYASKSDCEANTAPNTGAFRACGQYTSPEENKTTLSNSLNTISFGAFENYTDSFSPDKVKKYWETHYNSREECQSNFSGRAKGYCDQIDYTSEQLSSSVKLGSIITAEGALLASGLGYGAGAVTGGAALTQGLAISTVYQTGQATSSCIDDPSSSRCKEDTAWAAISWANVGTAANLTNAITSGVSQAINTARNVNTAVNVVNIGADIYDASNTCFGENATGLGCALSTGAGLLDVGGGVLDIAKITKPLNNLLDNTVFTGLTGNTYWGGGLSNSGGQTLISRSNMPANLTPQEQTLWLAKAEIVENWSYYTTLHPLTKSTFHGYQPYSASSVYSPASITQALNETPDPLGYLQFLETQQGLSPNEILNNSRDFISQKGIMIAETPPPNNQWWIDLPSGQGVSWNSNLNLPFENPSTNLGTHHGPLTNRALTVEGTPFGFPSDGNLNLPYEPYPGDVLELNRLALDQLGPSVELKTTSHELGHAIEQTYMPQRQASFWDFDEIKNKWVIVQGAGNPATEFISTLYGIKAAQAVAPYSLNMALDAINGNLFLNTWVTNPNPNYLAP